MKEINNLNSSNMASYVLKLTKECKTNENDEDLQNVRGIKDERYMFNKIKLAENKANIQKLVNELPKSFSNETGESVTALRDHKDGDQWTGDIRTALDLLALAEGIGLVKYAMPRSMWKSMFYLGLPKVILKQKTNEKDMEK